MKQKRKRRSSYLWWCFFCLLLLLLFLLLLLLMRTYTCARARNCQKESRTKKMRVYVVYERYFFFGFRRPLPFFLKKGAQFAPPPHKKTRINSKHNTIRLFKTQKRKMGFLGLGRKKKSEAELLEEERLRRQSMPWYARLFGTECCGNRGGKREKEEEKKKGGGA